MRSSTLLGGDILRKEAIEKEAAVKGAIDWAPAKNNLPPAVLCPPKCPTPPNDDEGDEEEPTTRDMSL